MIISAGGHGAVVLDILRAEGKYRPVGFIDADPALAGTEVGGLPVLGPTNILPKWKSKVTGVIVAIGDNRIRRTYAAKLARDGFGLLSAVHPAAHVSPTATLGKNIVVAAGAVVSTLAKVGDSAVVNTAAVVDHECEIGEAAHLGPGCRLGARVRIGAGALVGIGACVLPCISVGEDAVVGAGAVVLRDVEPRDTVVGVPARSVRRAAPAKSA